MLGPVFVRTPSCILSSRWEAWTDNGQTFLGALNCEFNMLGETTAQDIAREFMTRGFKLQFSTLMLHWIGASLSDFSQHKNCI